jgi:Carbohydrate family 9 binding domain-like
MRQLFSLLILLILLSCKNIKHQEPSIFIDLSTNIVKPKHYIVAKSNAPIVIDGKASESSWQSALFTDSFIDIEGIKTPKYDTKVKMLWDKNYLYIFAQMEEPHVWGYLKQHDTIIYLNNDFEIFIAPSGTTRNYGEIEINVLGTIWDLLLDKPYRDFGKANNHWNLDDLKSAVYIDGSLNNYTDIDSFWSVELAIPMKALVELKNKPRVLPKENEQWRINFSRVEWDYNIINGAYRRKKEDNDNYQSEYNWVWSNQNTINMHEPEKWGIIQFTNKTAIEHIAFIEDEHMYLKQIAFALFRQTKKGSLKMLLNETVGNTRTINIKYSNKNNLRATFYKTNLGFEYKINTPHSNQVYIINETGVLKKFE